MSIPAAIRTPGNYFHIDAAPQPFNSKNKQLLIGHMVESGGGAGTATIDLPVICSKSTVKALFGAKSMLASMYDKAKINQPFQEIWALPVAAVGAAMTGTITVANASANLGEAVLYIVNKRISVIIQSGETDNDVADKLATAINNSAACVSAIATDAVVALTCIHKGALDISLALDVVGDEGTVGLNTLTFSAAKLAGGNGVPDETTALLSLGDNEFDYPSTAFNSTTNLDRLRNFIEARWSYASQTYGQLVTATAGTASELTTIGNGRNDRFITNMGTSDSISPVWDWAAAYGAQLATHLGYAPELSRPLQGIVLEGIRSPKTVFDQTERNTLLFDGIATFNKNTKNKVKIDRAITMYRVTEDDVTDASWLDVNTTAQAMYFVRFQNAKLGAAFDRKALADENPNNIKDITTPQDIRLVSMQGYMDLMNLGVCENPDAYEKLLTVQRPDNDATRVDIGSEVDWVNQLIVMAIGVKSNLQIRG